jgi:hypothetical protein
MFGKNYKNTNCVGLNSHSISEAQDKRYLAKIWRVNCEVNVRTHKLCF